MNSSIQSFSSLTIIGFIWLRGCPVLANVLTTWNGKMSGAAVSFLCFPVALIAPCSKNSSFPTMFQICIEGIYFIYALLKSQYYLQGLFYIKESAHLTCLRKLLLYFKYHWHISLSSVIILGWHTIAEFYCMQIFPVLEVQVLSRLEAHSSTLTPSVKYGHPLQPRPFLAT